jgi:hypothetical protein
VSDEPSLDCQQDKASRPLSYFLKVVLVAVGIGVLAIIFVPVPHKDSSTKRHTRDLNHMKHIGLAMIMYSEDHDSHYPADFSYLSPYIKPAFFVSERDAAKVGEMSSVMEWASFVYIPGPSSERSVLAFLPPGHQPDNPGIGLILYADCSARALGLDEFTRELKEGLSR